MSNNKAKTMMSIVVAQCKGGGIGLNNTLPWSVSADMKRFKQLTSSTSDSNKMNAVVMGRKTYESLPANYRPLSGRVNVVLSRNAQVREQLGLPSTVLVAHSLDEVFGLLPDTIERVFVIGGEALYREALSDARCVRVYLTQIHASFPCDAFFPTVSAADFRLVSRSEPIDSSGISFSFLEFERIEVISMALECRNHEELQYLSAIRMILDTGVRKMDRTGTGTLSLFGVQMRFSLRDDVFPLLTTKNVFFRGVCEELLWFIKGSTDASELANKDVHIWDGNGSREFLDSRGLSHHEAGDLGPVYGFQWRHFGAEYMGMHASYVGKGVDQLARCIDTLKTNPHDRRIILTAWNPADVDKMALPPCHMFCQFYVGANQELSCQMYQRSADMGLGVPFNVASYALLTRMVAQVCGLKCGDFVHCIGDAHVYLNHVEALREQLLREPRTFPRLTINPNKKNIDDFEYADFTVLDYKPYSTIKMQMAV